MFSTQQPVQYAQQYGQPQAAVQHAQPVQYAQQPVRYVEPQAAVQYAQPQPAGGYQPQAEEILPPAMDAQTYATMKQLFDQYDTDKSNTLGIDELVQVMQQVGMQVPPDVNQMFAEYDMDQNGKISFTEFMAAFHTAPNPPPPQINGGVAMDGKFVDMDFPPDNNSIFASPNPAADHVQDVVNHAGGPGVEVQWKRLSEICPNGRLFHHVHPNDIAQGVLGDCWLLAAMAGLAEFEGAVLHMFKDKRVNDQGMYQINLFNPVSKQWEAVVVDDFVPLGPDGHPLMAKPQENEMWVLLLEKAFAKWFGSYVQIQGAYCLVGFMFMADCEGHCKCFSQSPQGRPPFNEQVFSVVGAHLQDAHNRNSVALAPMGQIDEDSAWHELVKHDASNHIMCAWTSKDPSSSAGRGASGEVISGNGVVKGHAYSLISARELQADGQVWRVLQLRNPWGANPAAEWKGPLSDHWPMWGNYPELAAQLEIGQGTLDGMFWISWQDFRSNYSDIGVVPKQMEVPRMGVIEGAGGPVTAKHGKKFKSSGALPAAPAAPAAFSAMEPIQQQQYVQPQYVQPSRTVYASEAQQPVVAYAAAPVSASYAPTASTYSSAPAVTYAAAPQVTYASAPMEPAMTYAASPVTYASVPTQPATTYAAPTYASTYAAAPVTYASAPTSYAAAPVKYAATPSSATPSYATEPTYAAAPVQYAAAPMTYAAAPVQYAAAPMTYAAAPAYATEPTAAYAPTRSSMFMQR